MWTTESWDIKGYNDKLVPNSFYSNRTDNSHLAIVFPGFGYPAEAPLLTYLEQLLLELGFDVLSVDYEYNRNPAFKGSSDSERRDWFTQDILEVSTAAMARPQYSHWVLAGKSLGTDAMLQILTSRQHPSKVRLIWVTPGSRHREIADQALELNSPSLFLVGTADPSYDPLDYQKMTSSRMVRAEAFPGADHSLEVQGNVDASIAILQKCIQVTRQFLQSP